MIRRVVGLGIVHPVLLNLLFWLIVVAGVAAWTQMPKEEFPQVQTDQIVVTASRAPAVPLELDPKPVPVSVNVTAAFALE